MIKSLRGWLLIKIYIPPILVSAYREVDIIQPSSHRSERTSEGTEDDELNWGRYSIRKWWKKSWTFRLNKVIIYLFVFCCYYAYDCIMFSYDLYKCNMFVFQIWQTEIRVKAKVKPASKEWHTLFLYPTTWPSTSFYHTRL